jgi:hypothetical protein
MYHNRMVGRFKIECGHCGKPAVLAQPGKFCSRRCKQRARDRRLHPPLFDRCLTCAAKLPRYSKKFCSAACAPYVYKPPKRPCLWCGELRCDGRRKFCCFDCSRKWEEVNKPARRCRECGKDFFEKQGHNYYCNDACFIRDRTKRRRARRIKIRAAKDFLRELEILPPLPVTEKPGWKKGRYSDTAERQQRRQMALDNITEAERLWTTWDQLFNPVPWRWRQHLDRYVAEILSLRGRRVSWHNVFRWRHSKWQRRKNPKVGYFYSKRDRKRHRRGNRETIRAQKRRLALKDTAILQATSEFNREYGQ